ncbi:MAG: hypothetical protein H6779_05325 [Candidatus Nomurabacteria bacterium]|nr:MAG: hypothetical protein H6779_05325 [Candidatus Nomurabacteria bacterium]
MQAADTHNFHDINKLPKEYGILVFPISISRAQNKTGQEPDKYVEYLKYFSPSKVSAPKAGVNFVYSDSLYLHSDERASVLKYKFMNIVLNHKNSMQKLLFKERQNFQIQHAFSYEVWNQFYLSYDGNFASDLARFKEIYNSDERFLKYLKEDADFVGRKLDENQINFFLEEHLMIYLSSKKKISLPNEYIMGREQWVLWAYPGVPLKAQLYTYQLNPLNLDAPENPYQNHSYDLESKVLTDALKVDLDSYNYKYPKQ